MPYRKLFHTNLCEKYRLQILRQLYALLAYRTHSVPCTQTVTFLCQKLDLLVLLPSNIE